MIYLNQFKWYIYKIYYKVIKVYYNYCRPLKLFVLEENPKKYLVKNLKCMLKLRNSTQKNILGNTI